MIGYNIAGLCCMLSKWDLVLKDIETTVRDPHSSTQRDLKVHGQYFMALLTDAILAPTPRL